MEDGGDPEATPGFESDSGRCGLLGSEPEDGRSFCFSFFPVTAFFKKCFYLQETAKACMFMLILLVIVILLYK